MQGSTIIGMEHHTPENIRDEIEHAVAHDADCHQFMLYTPVPGTPLHAEMQAQGRMLDDVDLADIHGQYKFNFKHAAHRARRLEVVARLGVPARLRAPTARACSGMMRTMFEGWKRYGQDRDARVRARFDAEADKLRQGYGAALWAMERYLRDSNAAISERVARPAAADRARVRRTLARHRSRRRPGAALVGAAGGARVPDRPPARAADVRRPAPPFRLTVACSTARYG